MRRNHPTTHFDPPTHAAAASWRRPVRWRPSPFRYPLFACCTNLLLDLYSERLLPHSRAGFVWHNYRCNTEQQGNCYSEEGARPQQEAVLRRSRGTGTRSSEGFESRLCHDHMTCAECASGTNGTAWHAHLWLRVLQPYKACDGRRGVESCKQAVGQTAYTNGRDWFDIQRKCQRIGGAVG